MFFFRVGPDKNVIQITKSLRNVLEEGVQQLLPGGRGRGQLERESIVDIGSSPWRKGRGLMPVGRPNRNVEVRSLQIHAAEQSGTIDVLLEISEERKLVRI